MKKNIDAFGGSLEMRIVSSGWRCSRCAFRCGKSFEAVVIINWNLWWNRETCNVFGDSKSFVLTIVIHFVWSWNLMHRIVYDLCVAYAFQFVICQFAAMLNQGDTRRIQYSFDFSTNASSNNGTSVTNCNLTYLSQHLCNTTRDAVIVIASHFVLFLFYFFFFWRSKSESEVMHIA